MGSDCKHMYDVIRGRTFQASAPGERQLWFFVTPYGDPVRPLLVQTVFDLWMKTPSTHPYDFRRPSRSKFDGQVIVHNAQLFSFPFSTTTPRYAEGRGGTWNLP